MDPRSRDSNARGQEVAMGCLLQVYLGCDEGESGDDGC